jgi:hypothetical protein
VVVIVVDSSCNKSKDVRHGAHHGSITTSVTVALALAAAAVVVAEQMLTDTRVQYACYHATT